MFDPDSGGDESDNDGPGIALVPGVPGDTRVYLSASGVLHAPGCTE